MKHIGRRWLACLCLAGVCLVQAVPAAQGAITIAGPTNHLAMLVIPPDGDVVRLNPDPVTYLASATAAMQARLAAEFGPLGFTFNYNAGGLNGTLQIHDYLAASGGPHNGGADLVATYTRAATDPVLADLHFVQLIHTSDPLGGPTSPYIDPRPGDDPGGAANQLPWYWTLAEEATEKNAGGGGGLGTFNFSDASRRNCQTHGDFIWWRAELMLASWDGNMANPVQLYDGLRWGFDLTCVPEPSALLIWSGLAMAVAGAHRWRQRKTKPEPLAA